MIVVADSGPVIALVNIGHINVLEQMFGAVIIPATVARELAYSRRPKAVQEFIAAPPPWLSIRAAASIEAIPDIHDVSVKRLALLENFAQIFFSLMMLTGAKRQSNAGSRQLGRFDF